MGFAVPLQVAGDRLVTMATLPGLKNGAYYDDCAPSRYEAANASNEEDAIRLFNLCVELTKDFK